MKKWIAALLVMLLILPANAYAAGEGTKEIHTVKDLLAVAEDPDGSYILMENLDLTGVEWMPLDFRGTFDGNGKAILNLELTQPGSEKDTSYDGNIKEYDTSFVGFFGTLRKATVKNLKLLNVHSVLSCDVPVFMGGLAGFSQESTVSDCTVVGRLELRAHDRMFGVAGVVGYGTGTVENCTADVTLICTDTDPNTKDEQFMGGINATGFMDVLNCQVKIDGYVSEYGYCHNGGVIGMYMQKPLGVGRQGKVTGNNVTGKITFFEKNPDRRAYCRPIVGETLATWFDYSGNTDTFERDERWQYDQELRPEMCESPAYTDAVTEPVCDDFGYTTHTCASCGYCYTDQYTLPAHKLSDWTVTLEPTTDREGSSTAKCLHCGEEFTRTEEKLPPPPTTLPPETTVAPTQPQAETEEPSALPESLPLILALFGVCILAVVGIVLLNRKPKK